MTDVAITIFGVPDDPNNQLVRERVRTLPGVTVEVVVCPPSVRHLYRVPFVQDETGSRYFGVEGVDRFVARRLKTRSA